jgi:FemAB-related protein (PEP-CTERM system-associated)
MLEITHTCDKDAWDGYLSSNRAALFSHAFAWGETLATVYGLPIIRLAAVDRPTNHIRGLLPLVLFRPPGQAGRLISLPYTDAAGIVADDRETCRRLLHAALALTGERGAAHLELRQAGNMSGSLADWRGDWAHTAHQFKTGLRRRLAPTRDEQWANLSAKVRNQVRKARRSGCVAQLGGEELLADFYAVFSENMRDLGSPVHAPELFRQLLRRRSLRTAVLVIYLQAVPVAAALVLQQGTTLFNPWAASLRRYRPACPNMLLYWAMLEQAIEAGCAWFDFGRSSPDAPTCRFKRQWGARLEPLAWHVFSRGAQAWDPRNETLEYGDWKCLELERSRRDGPPVRRWISL